MTVRSWVRSLFARPVTSTGPQNRRPGSALGVEGFGRPDRPVHLPRHQTPPTAVPGSPAAGQSSTPTPRPAPTSSQFAPSFSSGPQTITLTGRPVCRSPTRLASRGRARGLLTVNGNNAGRVFDV